jgi:chromatin remodeling complex protein RSC6
MSDTNTAAIEAVATAINRLADAVFAMGGASAAQAGGSSSSAVKPAKKARQEALVKVSDELSRFTGISADAEVTRQEATALVMKYVKDNGLQAVDDKRNIVPDAALTALIGSDAVLKVLNLKSSLKDHFSAA